ncbi:MAG: PAS domain S-box protein [Verrucomicrobiota bacterium]
MKPYSEMTKAELLQRINELEQEGRTATEAREGEVSSERQRASSAIRDREERLRAILETAVEGIITIDERGIIESANRAAERIFGYAATEVIGKNVSVLMPSPYREEHDGYMANYLRSGKARIIGIGREVVGQRKDGSVFPMDLSVSEVKLADRRLFTGFVRDITDRKRAEQQLAELADNLAEKNKELEAIVYVASHDLRSPLVNIQGFSKELTHTCAQVRKLLASQSETSLAELRHLLDKDVPEALQYIQAGVNKIDVLLSGFLRFSRLGRAALKIEPVNMNRLLADVAKSMEFQLKQAEVSLNLQPVPDCLGDATQLNQVFTNLIDNAIKYRSRERSGEISITGHTDDKHAVYHIADNGIGIRAEHQHKIFEIFHRLDPSATEGEGLGLTIAQRSLERQNGRIRVESEPGKGSQFTVSLPKAQRTKEPHELKP